MKLESLMKQGVIFSFFGFVCLQTDFHCVNEPGKNHQACGLLLAHQFPVS